MAGLFDFLMKAKLSLEPNIDPQALGKMKKGTRKAFNDAFSEASKKGIFSTKQAKELFRNISLAGDAMTDQVKKVARLQQKIQQETQRGNDTKALKSAMEREKLILQRIQARYAKEEKFVKRMTERRKAAVEEAGKLAERTMGEAAEEFGEGIGRAFEDIKSFNFADLFKRAGKKMEVRGAGMTQKGAEQGGAMGKMMQGFGGILTKLGPMLATIGAVAAGLAALVKMVIDADAKVKELNRTMLDSGVAAHELADGYGNIGDTMDRVRQTFTTGDGAFSFNRIWGTTAKEHLEILGAYSQAGLTFKEITAGVKDAREEMQRLRDATAGALAYSKLLGLSTTEITEHMATYMEELGLTLEGVHERFSAIAMAAKESGFGVKRFFNMVLQATTGMSMYNVRLEEAAGLLIQLGKILGSKMGGDFLQQLSKGFMDEGMTDRYKRVMTTGGKLTGDIMEKSAEHMAADFSRKLQDLSQTQYDSFSGALREFGINPEADPKALVGQFAKLSAVQQQQLLAKAELSGNADMVRQLRGIVQLSRGAKGGTGDKAMALGGLDMGGKLAMQLNQVAAIIKKPLSQMDFTQRAAFEAITGTSGEQAEALVALGERFQGRWSELEKLSNAVKGDSSKWSEETAQKMAETYGVYVDKEGKIRKATFDEERKLIEGEGALVDTFLDLLMGSGKELEKAGAEKVKEDIALAQEIVRNTADISTILEQGVEWWLEQVHTVMTSISNLLMDDDERKNRASALNMVADEIKSNREVLRKLEKERNDLKASLKRGLKGTEKDEAEQKIAAIEDKMKVSRARMGTYQEAQSEIHRNPAEDVWFWQNARSTEDFVSQAMDAASERIYSTVDEAFGSGTAHREYSAGQTGAKEQALARFDKRYERYRPPPGSYGAKQMEAKRSLVGHEVGKSTYTGLAGVLKFLGIGYKTRIGEKTFEGKAAVTDGGVEGQIYPYEAKALEDVGSVGGEKTEEVMDAFADRQKAERLRERNRVLKEERALHTKEVIAAEMKMLRQLEDEREEDQVVRALLAAGAEFTNIGQARSVARELMTGSAGGTAAAVLGKETFSATGDPMGSVVKRLKDPSILGMFQNPRVLEAIMSASTAGAKPKANDFLMHIGEGGQVKFAQRIDSADQVTAVAAKGGGAIDQAGRRGGGATVVNHHYYNDAKGVYSQWQKLARARAL